MVERVLLNELCSERERERERALPNKHTVTFILETFLVLGVRYKWSTRDLSFTSIL